MKHPLVYLFSKQLHRIYQIRYFSWFRERKGFLPGSNVKNLLAVQEPLTLCWVRLEEGMSTPYSIPAWRIPRTEEPGRLYTVHRVTKRQTQLKSLSTHAGRETRVNKTARFLSLFVEFIFQQERKRISIYTSPSIIYLPVIYACMCLYLLRKENK